MSDYRPTVLVLDDEKNIRQSIDIALSQEDIDVIQAHEPAAAFRVLRERQVDALIVDIQLGEVDGLSFFRKLQSDGVHIPTLFISGQASLTEAARAVKIGGYDFLEKPFSSEKLVVLVKRCLEHSRLNEKLRAFEARDAKNEIIGDAANMRQIIGEIAKVAASNACVHITGESGTGKELVANSIHNQSKRSDAPFVKVNCSAIPENLIESELFGFEKGAFTGAIAAKRGLFEAAHRGTIFLDEVGDLSLAAQAKILRVLQSGEIQKVGSEKIMKVDVRVVSGTHKDLKKAVTQGLFREDLYYRLNVVPIRVPALRDRKEDIPLLTRFFTKQLCEKNNLKEKELDAEVLAEFQCYSWPGNVRELQNILERMLIMSGPRITTADLPEEVTATSDGSELQDDTSGQPRTPSASPSTLKDFRDRAEREFVIGILKKHAGNISQSAIELGVGRTYLHKRLSVLGIVKRDYFS